MVSGVQNGTDRRSDETRSSTPEDPHCPECGEPIGQTATYCMHCSADLTDERAAADADDDGAWDRTESTSSVDQLQTAVSERKGGDQLLAPDGAVDNTLTVVVGIIGGIIVGVVGTIVLGAVTGSGWAVPFGLLAWLGSTAYLVRRRTVQGAVAKSGYVVAVVLLATPLIALSPFLSVDGGIGERGGLFFVLLVFVAVPAAFAAVTGWIAGRFVPANVGRTEN